MTDLFDNPLGTDGFEFVEFTSPEPERLQQLFEQMGFVAVVAGTAPRTCCASPRATSTSSSTWSRPASRRRSAPRTGPRPTPWRSGSRTPRMALKLAVERGAKPVHGPGRADGAEHPGHRGDRRLQPLSGRPLRRRRRSTTSTSGRSRARRSGSTGHGPHLHRPPDPQCAPRPDGRTGPTSTSASSTSARSATSTSRASRPACSRKAMTSPDGKIRIPLNESQDEHSQIEEFLRDYNGEGIQHIALGTDDIFDTVEAMRERGREVPGHAGDLLRAAGRRACPATARACSGCAPTAS